jgi:putative nucleotidyltransferase with HDIG domain
MEIKREQALALLVEYVPSVSLQNHCKAVEAAMSAYAKKYNEEEELWRVCGLLHDFDYEKFPDEHPFKGVEILKEKGYPDEIIQAILGHATYSGVARVTQMAKCLFAVDELSGFIVACARVRPEGFKGMKPKSVKKKLKVKSFAAQVSREEIDQGIEELGVDKDEHINLIIDALSEISEEFKFD